MKQPVVNVSFIQQPTRYVLIKYIILEKRQMVPVMVGAMVYGY